MHVTSAFQQNKFVIRIVPDPSSPCEGVRTRLSMPEPLQRAPPEAILHDPSLEYTVFLTLLLCEGQATPDYSVTSSLVKVVLELAVLALDCRKGGRYSK